MKLAPHSAVVHQYSRNNHGHKSWDLTIICKQQKYMLSTWYHWLFMCCSKFTSIAFSFYLLLTFGMLPTYSHFYFLKGVKPYPYCNDLELLGSKSSVQWPHNQQGVACRQGHAVLFIRKLLVLPIGSTTFLVYANIQIKTVRPLYVWEILFSNLNMKMQGPYL